MIGTKVSYNNEAYVVVNVGPYGYDIVAEDIKGMYEDAGIDVPGSQFKSFDITNDTGETVTGIIDSSGEVVGYIGILMEQL